MKVLVTGGAGFIGSHTVKALKLTGHEVVVFDSLAKGHRAALPGFVEGKDLFVGELSDKQALETAIASQPFDAVIHFAAWIEVGESVKNPAKYFTNNTGGTIALLEAMSRHSINQLVFSSTAAVYGEPKKVPVKETAVKSPESPYGLSKWLVEQMIEATCSVTPLKATVLRYFNACGADPDGELGQDYSPPTHLIPIILRVPLGQSEKIKIFGDDYPTPDGTAVRDYIHVADLAAAHVLALEKQSNHRFRVFNVGTGNGYSVKEVLEMCRKVTGHPISAENVTRRPGDPARLIADSAKIRRELGWTPKYSDLKTIIETTWKWRQKHPNGYEKA